MHALRKIHAALVPDGLLVDTQPIGSQPRVAANGDELGMLDMHEWMKTIRAVDGRVAETVAAGLYERTNERTLVIRSTFDDGPDCLEITGTWQGTRVPQPLADRLAAVRDPVSVDQQVRLRVLRRGPAVSQPRQDRHTRTVQIGVRPAARTSKLRTDRKSVV